MTDELSRSAARFARHAPTSRRSSYVPRVPGRAEYLCYTDGSCKAGDGAPGGWGFFIRPPNGQALEGFGKARGTLAKVMEYRAVAEALAALPDRVDAVVFSDNQSLVENLTRNLETWRAAAFAKVDPLVVESVRAIDDCILRKQLAVRWQWVRSHNGNVGNERADALAAQGARAAKSEIQAEKKG
jgi:ribonuclease HI